MKGIGHSAQVSDINPMGTDGFEFVEFASAEPAALHDFFTSLGFQAAAHHKVRDVTLYRQGDIHFLVNGDAGSFGHGFYQQHGPCACSFGLRVADAEYALERALSLGAEQGESEYSVDGREIPVSLVLAVHWFTWLNVMARRVLLTTAILNSFRIRKQRLQWVSKFLIT